MDNIKLLTLILAVVVGLMMFLLIILAGIYLISKTKKAEKTVLATQKPKSKEEIGSKNKKYKEYRKESIMNFLEFDTVVDNMISQKNGNRYVMVVECQGVNYDLMSQVEKNSVEEAFVQFLNTLRYPVQIYTQTRTINLEDSIQTYRTKVDEIKFELDKMQARYDEMKRSGKYTEEQLKKAYFDLTKETNLYEYGKDIIYNTERMSMNRNVLNKKYYVVIPYFVEELENDKFDKLEQRNYAFSELYTRAQATMRTLSSCGINSKVLDSYELVELLYMAYNRDDAEIYGVNKAIRAGYDELYTTAQDVVDKQIKALDEEIEQKAIEKAKLKLSEARSARQKELQEKRNNENDLIDELAKVILKENEDVLEKGITDEAIDILDNEKKKEGTKDDAKQKATRGRKKKTAQ